MEGYDYVRCLKDGLAIAKKNNKYGYVDKTGKVVVPIQYDETWFFSEGLAGVKQNGKWGFIDKTGEVVIPF
ncbi:WG repeat-containing protein [Moraxella bovoculi]|uniref:WG repeat-containing protein n=1 Tax=Moraxella bovoculi TaxID=386891 RepID=UPI003F4F7A97